MPRDVSSSSSEDDAVAEPSVPRAEKKPTRFQCPADFVTLSHKPCSSTLMESLRNDSNDLWLIKAPASFNPECFSGIKMKLSGLQTLKVPSAGKEAGSGSGQQIFSVLTSNHGTSELRLLTSDKQSSDSMVFGPAFAGLVNMCESFGGSGASQPPHVIPAAPAPTIPPGLKQRFHPFGSKAPKLAQVAGSEVDGAAFGPSSTSLRPLVVKHFAEEAGEEEEEESKKKKKKKKKDKRIKTESMEEQMSVKQEPSQEILEEMVTGATLEEGHVSEEKKKKRKKKDREAAEPSLEVKVEPDMVKRELIDSSYGDADETPEKKKKKKKKRSKTEDD